MPVLQYYYDAPEINTAQSVDTALDPFTVYISRIDTRENELLKNSRGDVNLLPTVNPQTDEILLVSIPRDYYVETVCEPDMGCMNGAMGKLTHTGLHGAETTEMALEKLFGIEINYNVRVNFSSLVKVVDELGGVTVYNPEAFTSVSGQTFAQGGVKLNGTEALAFVRERYAFTDDDRARGRNQMRVLTAIIDKCMSPKILTNFNGIMSSMSSSFQTNMSEKERISKDL
ncbi:LCP family protein [Faecalibaculum rodentium]|uniref:LCP family protein n=1 Tax=Faecalibaculum rodentium TaxID=1702221 RepID=UPI0025748BDC|nr:LCP family protein [Faecalibaculum rodentium]